MKRKLFISFYQLFSKLLVCYLNRYLSIENKLKNKVNLSHNFQINKLILKQYSDIPHVD